MDRVFDRLFIRMCWVTLVCIFSGFSLVQCSAARSQEISPEPFAFESMYGDRVMISREGRGASAVYTRKTDYRNVSSKSCIGEEPNEASASRYMICVQDEEFPLVMPIAPPKAGDEWTVGYASFVVLERVSRLRILNREIDDVFVIETEQRLQRRDYFLIKRHRLFFSYSQGLLTMQGINSGAGDTQSLYFASSLPSLGAR